MSVYVDFTQHRTRRGPRFWMWADQQHELADVAQYIGLPRRRQRHEVTLGQRMAAQECGAMESTMLTWLRSRRAVCSAAG